MAFAYTKLEQVIALNVDTIKSFCLSHLAAVRAFRILSVCFALVTLGLELGIGFGLRLGLG